jgi:hypothetical protein
VRSSDLVSGTSLYYIKSLDKYLCFIELDFSFENSQSMDRVLNQDNEDERTSIGATTPLMTHYYSTFDKVSTYNCNNEYGSEPFAISGWIKKSINLNIVGQNVQIEVWTPNSKTFTITQTENSFTWACGTTNGLENCQAFSITKNYNFSDPLIEIKGWQKEDFDKDVIFPPKMI